ncbi:hypothetical protein [Streptomyces sp. NPDC058644]|uniref:hypothetical protein n=1 Tax=unclassified Streptomyces TaxID=2593676 RepID=UPI003660E709
MNATEPENYPGELAMLRGLVMVIHTIAKHSDIEELRRVLAEHETDERAAYSALGEKSSRKATATPTGPTGRLAQLLDAIRTHRGDWTTKRVQDLYRGTPLAPPNAPNGRLRAVARGDLRDLHAWGHLVEHDEKGRHFYTLNSRKDGHS